MAHAKFAKFAKGRKKLTRRRGGAEEGAMNVLNAE